MPLTEWFSHKQKPKHIGVYQRCHEIDIAYSYWDGQHWYMTASSPVFAYRYWQWNKKSNFQKRQWRGVAK